MLMWTIEQQRRFYREQMIWYNLPYLYHDGYLWIEACIAKNEI